jgi:hypothetical protein
MNECPYSGLGPDLHPMFFKCGCHYDANGTLHRYSSCKLITEQKAEIAELKAKLAPLEKMREHVTRSFHLYKMCGEINPVVYAFLRTWAKESAKLKRNKQ